MTQLRRSVFVIPSSTLDELPTGMGNARASDFLNAWTSQWDPRLLVHLSAVPEWKRADGSALDLEHALVLCPEVSKTKIDQPQRERLQLGHCVLVDSMSSTRAELVLRIIASTGCVASTKVDSEGDEPEPSVAPLLCDEFYALGYAVLQIQMLARKLRYSWNMDWIVFTEQVLSAARASLARDAEETERWLQASFDSLSQERDRYCSQQANLLDVVLLAPTTLGAGLSRQLESTHPINLLACSQLLQTLRQTNNASWVKLNQMIQDKQLSIVGGLETENPFPYYSGNSVYRQIGRGLRSYCELGIDPPKIFSRYRSGYTSNTPLFLSKFGFVGAVLSAWTEGTVPDKDQAKIRWQASTETRHIDTLIGHVLDASNADTYIDLAGKLAKQLDYHQVPTLVFAHWPSEPSTHAKDLNRLIQRSPALGTFQTGEKYFASTSQPYSGDTFANNAFKLPLPTSVTKLAHLHQRIASYERLRIPAERLQSLQYLWTQVALHSQAISQVDGLTNDNAECESILATADAWFANDASDQESTSVTTEALYKKLESLRILTMQRIAKVLLKDKAVAEGDNLGAPFGYLLINPSNHPQRVFLEKIDGTIDSSSSKRIVACETRTGKSNAVVDVPPFGFVKLRTTDSIDDENAKSSSASTGAHISGSKPTLWNRLLGARSGIAANDWTLANEFMEVQIDPKKGHLRSVYVANKRGSRLSGMASIVSKPTGANDKWSDADCAELSDVRLRVVESTSLIGTIEVSGTAAIADGKKTRITTRYTLWKSARAIQVEVTVENLDIHRASCVWRTAWMNEGASVSAWQQGVKGKLQAPLQSTVEMIEINDAEHRVYVATHGMSSHRRSESRFLISELPLVDNKRFAFSIGLDWPRPYDAAMDSCDSAWVIPISVQSFGKNAAVPDEGAWLAQCSVPNLQMRFVDPRPTLDPTRLSADQMELMTGKSGNVCVWLTETMGKSGGGRLSFFRDVSEAWRVDSQGREFDTLSVNGGVVTVDMQAYEQARILIRWKSPS
jgi:hypothetical protein